MEPSDNGRKETETDLILELLEKNLCAYFSIFTQSILTHACTCLRVVERSGRSGKHILCGGQIITIVCVYKYENSNIDGQGVDELEMDDCNPNTYVSYKNLLTI